MKERSPSVSIEGWLSPRSEDPASTTAGSVGFLVEETEAILAQPSSPHEDGDESKKALNRRQLRRVMNELVETERAYLSDLDVLVDHIMAPMKEKKDFMTGEHLVTE